MILFVHHNVGREIICSYFYNLHKFVNIYIRGINISVCLNTIRTQNSKHCGFMFRLIPLGNYFQHVNPQVILR